MSQPLKIPYGDQSFEIKIFAAQLRHIHRDHLGAGIPGCGFSREKDSREPWHILLEACDLKRFRAGPGETDRSAIATAVMEQAKHSLDRPLYVQYRKTTARPRSQSGRSSIQWELLCPSGLSVVAVLDRQGPDKQRKCAKVITAFFRTLDDGKSRQDRWWRLLLSRKRRYCVKQKNEDGTSCYVTKHQFVEPPAKHNDAYHVSQIMLKDKKYWLDTIGINWDTAPEQMARGRGIRPEQL